MLTECTTMGTRNISSLTFKKPILIYLPCYNCGKTIGEVLENIPENFHGIAECLVLDNLSEDSTIETVLREKAALKDRIKISLIRNRENYGYAGSQKLAYSLACRCEEVKYVIMLHGDGQYPPSLITKFLPFIEKDYAVVNGYRSKDYYPEEEETPICTYLTIKLLNVIESFITGIQQREWHSGFVMYSTEFLRRIPLSLLSNTRHIDGEFLYCAGILGANTASVPIYKQYIGREAFGGVAKVLYLAKVLQAIVRYKTNYYHKVLEKKTGIEIDYKYDVPAFDT